MQGTNSKLQRNVTRRLRPHAQRFLVAAVALLTATTSQANYTCGGRVRGVAMDVVTGDVLAESLGPLIWPRLCSINNTVGKISPEACKRIHATLLLAQQTQKSVTVWIDDSSGISECKPLPAWQWVNGFYFLRVDE